MEKVKSSDFDLSDYIDKPKIKARRSFDFKDGDIAKLPLLSEGTSIDLRDSGLDKELAEGAVLVLRISKTKKAFYPLLPKVHRGYKRRHMGAKIGDWMQKPNSNHFPAGFCNTRQARKALYQLVKEQKLLHRDADQFQKLTIKEYVEGGYYTADRKRKPMKNGHFNEPEESTIKTLLSQFPDHIDRKIGDVEEEWIFEIKKNWEKRGITTGTMRGYYSTFNSLFNMCQSMQYISNNPIDEHYYLFPRNPTSAVKNVYSWDFHDVIDFIFSDEFDEYYPKSRAAAPEGRIIVASCVLAGIRPIEARRNFANNFDVENQTIWIPVGIQKKTQTGRPVKVPHDKFWNEVAKYKLTLADPDGYMFPSYNSKNGYVSESKYRYHWTALCRKFNLSNGDWLYHNRHTLSTKLKETPGGNGLHASVIGDHESTANKFYATNTSQHAEQVMRSVYDSNKQCSKEPKQEENYYVSVGSDVVMATDAGMPDSVKQLFHTYKNGKSLPGPELMHKEQWDKFVDIVRQMSDNGMVDDADMWLMLQ